METVDLKASVIEAEEAIASNNSKRKTLIKNKAKLMILIDNEVSNKKETTLLEDLGSRILEIDDELAVLDQSDAFMVMKKHVNSQKIEEIEKIMSRPDAEYQQLRASVDIGRSILNEILEHNKKSPFQKFTSLIKEIFSK